MTNASTSPTLITPVPANTPIKQLLGLFSDCDVIDVETILPSKDAADTDAESSSTLERVVNALSVERMVAMGLGALPVEAIAVPKKSPLLDGCKTGHVRSHDISGKLSRFFPTSFVAALYEIQSLVARAEMSAYVVGGITRDLLLSQDRRLDIQDVDITVEGNAIELANYLTTHSRNFKKVEEYPEFGTVKLTYKDGLNMDMASSRREVYASCGALPEVVKRGVPMQDDILRRDFTINSLAFSINELGVIYDYTNGIEDLENELVRVLHPVSFFEDPSRIMRCFKFATRFDFTIAEETRVLMNQFFQHAQGYYKGGGDRIKQELKGFLTEKNQDAKARQLEYFVHHQAMRLIDMELNLDDADSLARTMVHVAQALPSLESVLSNYKDVGFSFKVFLCFLFKDEVDLSQSPTVKRLGLTKKERHSVEVFQRLCNGNGLDRIQEFASAIDIYESFKKMPASALAAFLLNKMDTKGEAIEALAENRRVAMILQSYKLFKTKFEPISPELDGNDLKDMGVPEGKQIGELLNSLLKAKLTGNVIDRGDEIQFIERQMMELNLEKVSTESQIQGDASDDE